MAEYIEREAAVSNLELLARHEDRFRQSVILGVVNTIRAMEASDVAPVMHATWVFTADFGPSELYHCSRCGREEVRFGKSSIYKQYPYCHCGAKMDGGAE